MNKFKIFLLGSNDVGEGISCVGNDISAIKTFFENYKYLPKLATKTKETELILELENYISDLNEDDVFIFYYAGHSILAKNSLNLYVDNEEIDFNIAINRTLKKQGQIKNVLFILDSCGSGKISKLIKDNSSFRSITATDYLGIALEMSPADANNLNIQSPLGFFTHFLLISMEELFQTQKELDINLVGEELASKIHDYKEKNLPTPVTNLSENNFVFIRKHDCRTIINSFFSENIKSNYDTFLKALHIKLEKCLITDCSNGKIFKRLLEIFKLGALTKNSKKLLLTAIKNELKKCL